MNNNNNIYNNNFIGSTHIDTYKATSNLIISTSNIIENHLYASNIANSNYTYNSSINNSNYTYNTSNTITNYFNKLIDNQIEHITFPTSTDLIHTYITNSNLGGEIRFYVKSTSLFPPFIPTDALPYRVRIKQDGKLYVYYTYDPSISLTNPTDWVDVGNTIVSILANNVNTGIALTGLQAEVLLLKDKEEADILGVYNAMVRLHEGDLIYDLDDLYNHRTGILSGLTEVETSSRLTDAFNNIRLAIGSQSLTFLNRAGNSIALMVQENPTISFAIGTGSVVFGIVYSIAQQGSFNNYLNSLYKDIRNNVNLTNVEQSNLIAYTSNTLIASNIVEMAVNYSNMTKQQGFINSNILTQQFINNLNTNDITYNGVNISNVFLKQTGGTLTGLLTGTTINTTVGLQEQGYYLDSKYLRISSYNTDITKINDTLNLNYTIEKKYPPKAYDSSTSETTTTFLGKTVYTETFIINDFINGYGIGTYQIWSSSVYNSGTTKKLLFNYNTTETGNSAHWGVGEYSLSSGIYIGTNGIKNDYLGDWLIVKLPSPIVLTRFRFYIRSGLNIRVPAKWRCYGSIDGINFIEIIEGSQSSKILPTDYSSGFYQKSLASTFITPYLYIGWTVNELTGNANILNFTELEIYGKELLNPIYNYVSSNVLSSTLNNYPNYNNILTTVPNLSKKYGFTAICATPILMPNAITYYKRDIDLRNYTQNKIAPNPSTPYRIFKIIVFLGSVYFETLTTSGNSDGILSYEIYMSNESQSSGAGNAGVNVWAIGEPRNLTLNSITDGSISLIRSSDYNYICIIAKGINTVVNIIIEDLLY